MIFNTDRLTELCVKYSITPTQFYLLYTIATKDWKNLSTYVGKIGTYPTAVLDVLRRKGLLVFCDNRGDMGEVLINANDAVVDKEFMSEIIVDIDEAYDRLFDAYPWTFTLHGEEFPARTGLTHVNTANFLKQTKGDPELINEIIELTEFGKENGLINTGLEKYIERKQWQYIKLKRTEGASDSFFDMG